VSDVTVKELNQRSSGEGACFEWPCKIDSGDDDAHPRYRRARIWAGIVKTELLAKLKDRGQYGYHHDIDLENGYTATCMLTFDGEIEPTENPDPRHRAFIKPYRELLLEWLESRPEFAHIEQTQYVNGEAYFRCRIADEEGDGDGDKLLIRLRRD
jgi:hypothetical protein